MPDKLKALAEQVIVIIEDIPEATESGILLTRPKFQALPKHGEVYAIGKEVKTWPGLGKLKVGQRIVFDENSPKGFRHGGHKLLRLYKEQIIGIYE